MNFPDTIFKAYDIRGISGEELTTELAESVGRAVADYLPDEGPVVVGRDMRTDSKDLAEAVIRGLVEQGRDVWDIGLVTTDMVYFSAGRFKDEVAGGVMVTASHNPGKYNGIKLIGKGSVPMGAANGLLDIKQLVAEDNFKVPERKGNVHERSVTREWVAKICEFLDLASLPAYKIAVDAGNGMGGAIFPALEKELPFTVKEMYFELDGTFPNHVANPHLTDTLKDLCAEITENGLDFGLAFDGDGDRGGIVDELGEPVPEHVVGALLTKQFLSDNPGGKVVYDLRTSHVVPDVVKEEGGEGFRSKVGNDSIKTIMRREGAVLGIEASGHYYFRDAYYSDSGMIAVMSVVNMLAKSGKKLSELAAEYSSRYATAPEHNLEVADSAPVFEALKAKFADGRQDQLDGLTVTYPDWWFNLRASNTEPLVRLNIEADNEALLEAKQSEVLAVITGEK
jgi:phosphomannomutase